MPGPIPDLDKTGYSCAGCQLPDSAEDEMVFCDHCQRWYHFGCAGVTDEVKDVSWCCKGCIGVAADKSGPPALEEELAKLEKEMEEKRQALEIEKILGKKRLEHQRKMFLLRQQVEKEKRDMELAFEKEQLEQELAEEEAHRKKRDQVLKKVQNKLKLLKIDPAVKMDAGKRSGQDEGGLASKDEDGMKKKTKKEKSKQATMEKKKPGRGKSEKEKSDKHRLEKADPKDASKGDPRGAYRKYSTPKTASGVPGLLSSSHKKKTPLGHPDLLTKKKKSKKQSISQGKQRRRR